MTINKFDRMNNIRLMTIYKWRRKIHIIEDSLENLSTVLLENRTLKEENENFKKILGEMTMKKEILLRQLFDELPKDQIQLACEPTFQL